MSEHHKDAEAKVKLGDLIREQFRRLDRNLSNVTHRDIDTYAALSRLVKREERK